MECPAVSRKIALALILIGSVIGISPPADAMPGMSAPVTTNASPFAAEPVYWVWIHHHRFWRHHHWHHWHR
jgi:hypothetical protein